MNRPSRSSRRFRPLPLPPFESLEPRQLLSANIFYPYVRPTGPHVPAVSGPFAPQSLTSNPSTASAKSTVLIASKSKNAPANSSSPVGYVPSQIRRAYGIDQVSFGNVTGDGSGQTIAIVDAFHYPTAYADLTTFSNQFGLYNLAQYTGSNTTPYFRQVSETGTTTYPSNDSPGGWDVEAALDIEWAHAIAPMANIMLVETASTSFTDMVTAAVGWARTVTGVSVISMSFGASASANGPSTEPSNETAYDSVFTTPSGHAGVTFVASTGDYASPAGYPAYSPNVVAVGGTALNIDSSGNYLSESAWSDGGGGVSTIESKPAYQSAITLGAKRMAPDLSMDASPSTGVAIIDSWYSSATPWLQVGGTSVASPMFAGVMAIADQGRSLAGLSSLDGPTQTLPAIYSIGANTPADFHDITTGSNGEPTLTGYDLATGWGTPVGPAFVQDLAGVATVTGTIYEDRNGNGVFDAGDVPTPNATVYNDANGNGVFDSGGSTTVASGTIDTNIPDNNTTGITVPLTFSPQGIITDVNVTLDITHPNDRDLKVSLIGPDNTTITLFNAVGGSSNNFTGTVLDDSATTAITSGSAPFSHSYRPATPLSTFNGKQAAGVWKLKIVDSRAGNVGVLNDWSITIATQSEQNTLTAANGSYALVVPAGPVTIREVAPAADIPTGPSSYTLSASNLVTGKDLGNFPTTFTAANPGDTYYLWLDPTRTQVEIGTTANTPLYQFSVNNLPALSFYLTAPGSKLVIDFTNGSPLPAGNILLDGAGLPDSELSILGQPTQTLTMTDTQIGLTGGPVINYQNLGTMSLNNVTVNYSGSLATLQNLNINSGTTFNWG